MELFDYDPVTGIRSFWEYNEDTGKGVFRREQDVSAVVDMATRIRNEVSDKRLEDDYMHMYAMIPVGVEMELMQKGISIYDPNNTRRLLEEINKNYPYLKTTDRTHVATK
jgi:hypothetical protein